MLGFSEISQSLSKIENTSGRLDMADVLSALFKKATQSEIEKLVYIIQGTLAPPYEGVDLGLGERFAIAAIASSAGYSPIQVETHYKKSGDLGKTAEELLEKKQQTALSTREMDISYVHSAFIRMAKASGIGSQELKIKMLSELLNNSTPLEARFIVRFVLGRLRLGVGDPTILDSLSLAVAGDRSLREPLERAYNVCSDLGHVAKTLYTKPEAIIGFKVQPFKPLMPALAERLSTPEEIIKKIGKCAIERKFDGFRIQCHKSGSRVEIYSRKLERMTDMFPEVVDAIRSLPVKDIIFEGEALAFDTKNNKYFSFQETMHRKRKHGISAAEKSLPLNVFCFDILYLEEKDLTVESYSDRRKALSGIFPHGILHLSENFIIDTPEALEKIFAESMDAGLEGIMAKDLSSPYAAGKRKFAWIKLKKSYGKSVDTIDAIIVGYFLGKGSRAEFEFGGLLVGVKNEDSRKLETVAKIGTGYSEEEMKSLQESLSKITTKTPPPNLEFNITPDFWVTPKFVVEIAFDEITRSPTHTCGMENGKGLALRFPRMVKLRDDKSVNEATTSQEVTSMFAHQKGGADRQGTDE
jgi:DNA ligase-1